MAMILISWTEVHTVKKGVLAVANKEIGLEGNVDRNKYMVMCRYRNIGTCDSVPAKSWFERGGGGGAQRFGKNFKQIKLYSGRN
jgi:hypothetical protein